MSAHEIALDAGVVRVELRGVLVEPPPPRLEREFLAELSLMSGPRLCYVLHAVALELKRRYGGSSEN